MTKLKYTYWRDGNFYVGYLNEYPDNWTQGTDLDDLKDHLKDLHELITAGHLVPTRQLLAGELEVVS